MPAAGRLTAQLACRQYYNNSTVNSWFKMHAAKHAHWMALWPNGSVAVSQPGDSGFESQSVPYFWPMLYTRLAVCIADSRCLRTRPKKIPVLQVLRHLFLLNKWQYRDKYIIVIVVVSEKIQLKNVKKVQWVAFEPGIASCNGGHAHHWATARAGSCRWPSVLNRNRKLLAVCTYARPLYTRLAVCIDTTHIFWFTFHRVFTRLGVRLGLG